MKLNIDWLKNNCQMIHYFGLGFIQLKINKNLRLHFYTSLLPPITPDEDIHNHRYDFNSKILFGELTQEIFELIPGNTYQKQEESCQEGIKPSSSPISCDIRLASRHTYGKNSNYFISHEMFHRVKASNCITLIERTDYKKALAHVVRPFGEVSVCPFSKKVDEKELWEIVDMIILRYDMS